MVFTTPLQELGQQKRGHLTEIIAIEESSPLLELRLGKAGGLANNTVTSLSFLPHSNVCPEALPNQKSKGKKARVSLLDIRFDRVV